jgi:hypothetical protein
LAIDISSKIYYSIYVDQFDSNFMCASAQRFAARPACPECIFQGGFFTGYLRWGGDGEAVQVEKG